MNWGNKLLCTFLVFGAGMTYLVYKCMKTDFELVEKDYYKSEIGFQQTIDASRRANELSTDVAVNQVGNRVFLLFPPELKGMDIQGVAWFYCPYDSGLDRSFAVETDSDARQQLEPGLISPGNYLLKLTWQTGATKYHSEVPVTIN